AGPRPRRHRLLHSGRDPRPGRARSRRPSRLRARRLPHVPELVPRPCRARAHGRNDRLGRPRPRAGQPREPDRIRHRPCQVPRERVARARARGRRDARAGDPRARRRPRPRVAGTPPARPPQGGSMTAQTPTTPELDEIRAGVRELCAAFPDEYWRGLEPDRYPLEFVTALTANGWLGALIPEEYGGAGLGLTAASVILEEINASGGNAAACHAQMYTMGTVLRHGSDEQKRRYLPRIASGELRLQAFGITEPSVGSDTTSIKTTATRVNGGYVVRGQKIWTSRALHSDLMLVLARTTPLEEVTR